MYLILLIINIVSAVTMVGTILLQHGRGAELGASFGRSSQGSLVSASGSTNFLSRTTSILAVVFFSTALALSVVPQSRDGNELLERLEAPSPVADETSGVGEEAELPQPSSTNK